MDEGTPTFRLLLRRPEHPPGSPLIALLLESRSRGVEERPRCPLLARGRFPVTPYPSCSGTGSTRLHPKAGAQVS